MHNIPRIHQEFKNLIPPLTPEEYDQLEQNILAQGCRDPITLWRGIIIDGHNRYEICTKHGLAFDTVKLRFPSRDAAKIWVLENQLGRRNLSDAMRIELAARKLKLMGQDTYARRNIARDAGVCERTVQRYMQIKAKGDPELVEKVMSGNMKIGTALRHIEVITTTREEMGKITAQTPEEKEIICIRGIMNSLSQLDKLFEFLQQHKDYCTKLPRDITAWLDSQYRRVPRLMERLEGEG